MPNGQQFTVRPGTVISDEFAISIRTGTDYSERYVRAMTERVMDAGNTNVLPEVWLVNRDDPRERYFVSAVPSLVVADTADVLLDTIERWRITLFGPDDSDEEQVGE
jgi:hypothetical protein